MILHIPTMLLMLVVVTMVMSVSIAYITFRRSRALGALALALLLHGTSGALFGLRGQEVPYLVSVVLGNVTLHTAASLYILALCRLHKRTVQTWLLVVPVVVAVLGVLLMLDNTHGRRLLVSAVQTLQYAVMLRLVWRGRHDVWGRGHYIVAAAALLACATMGYRFVTAWVMGPDLVQDLTENTAMAVGTVLSNLVIVLLLSVGMLFMELDSSKHELADSESRYRQLIESAHEGIIVLQGGLLRFVNRRFCELAGCSRELLLGQPVEVLIDPRDHAFLEANYQKRLAGQVVDNLRYVLRAITSSGEARWWEVSGVTIEWHGQPATLNFIMDITEQRKAQEQQRLAAKVFTHAYEGIMLTDAEGNILDVNAAFCRITGYERSEALGANPRMLQSGRHAADFYDDMWQQIHQNGFWQGEIWNRRKNGEEFPENLSIRAVPNEQGQIEHYVALFSDITHRKALEEKVQHLAFHDALTGLVNRRLLMDRLDLAVANAQRTGEHGALMFVDLDKFKFVNDTYGHDAGDQLLIEVARRLQQCVRKTDTVARLGGDEFVLLFPQLGRDSAHARHLGEELARKLLSWLQQPHRLRIKHKDGTESVVEHCSPGSVGVAVFSGDTDTNTIIKMADDAMYNAKAAGRNTYQFSS